MSTKIVSRNDYVAGWLDSSIHDFLDAWAPHAANAKYALITCLHSNPDPASLRKKSRHVPPIAPSARVLGTGLLLPTGLLLEAEARGRIFFGFDEVWFFPSNDIEPKPDVASLVGPARLDQGKLDALEKWMGRCSCSLALGDGEGLNFIVKARGLVRSLLGHSVHQAQPSVPPLETADSA
jgi:hypothetical protein